MAFSFTGKEKSNHGSPISGDIPKSCKSGKGNENRQVFTPFYLNCTCADSPSNTSYLHLQKCILYSIYHH